MENQDLILKTFGKMPLAQIPKEEIRPIKQAMFLALDLITEASGKELKAPILKYIIDDLHEVWSHETIEDMVEAFRRVARGKIYGKITLGDIHEVMKEVQEEHAIERERKHNILKNADK